MFDCVEKVLHTFFYKYGSFIAKHPLPFLIIPVIIAVALGAGMVFMTTENGIDELYAPENSPAYDAQESIENIYDNVRDDDLLPRQLTTLGLSGQVIVKQNGDGNVLTVSALKEALRLHSIIMNVSIEFSANTYTFSDICLMWDGNCDNVKILKLLNYTAEQIGELGLTYPFVSDDKGVHVFIGSELGGVSFFEDSAKIESAQYMQFTYYLRNNETVGLMWEKEFLSEVSKFESDEITVYRRASHSLEAELDVASKAVIPLFSITFTILINFSIWSSIMKDNVRSKPWLASLGVVSAGLAVISSFGLLSYIGVPYINVVGSTPFLILGIGVDDMFIMIAAWRTTNVHKTTKERMSEAFSDAAMSITITSITDALAFGIGAITYFRSVRIFCMYTGVAVLFDYAYQITFFAACMVLMGYREEKNLHAMTCRKVLPKEEAPSTAYRICCAGGVAPISDDELRQRQVNGDDLDTQHGLMLFFKDYFGPFITHYYTAFVVILIYCIYLSVSIWGVLTLEEGLKRRNLSPDSSYAGQYYDIEADYFGKYGPVVAMVITEDVDYSDEDIQTDINRTLTDLESSALFYGDDFTGSWLREYLTYLKARDARLGMSISETISKEKFIEILQDEFLTIPSYRSYVPDIRFDDTSKSILSSRFYVVGRNANNSNRERNLMLEARKAAQTSTLTMIAYHPAFIFFDQYIAIRPNTIQNIGIALAAMAVVALVMIPHPLCAVFVTISVVSIELGVVGFMSHWDVTLDSVSMINLILCIGFSVDFSAHIAYGFITAPQETPRERAIHSLYTLGMPITQGALSTILAVVALSFSDSYIFRTFFKTMFLVIGFGSFHGLVFLPVFLMLFVPFRVTQASEEDAGFVLVTNDPNLAFDGSKDQSGPSQDTNRKSKTPDVTNV